MSLAPVTVCAFDAYGTLFDLGSIPRLVKDELGEQAEALMRLWRKRQLEISWLPLRPGAPADFWLVTEEALDFAMNALSVEDRRLKARLMDGWMTPDAYPDVPDALLRLREMGYPTAILSNGSVPMLSAAVKRLGLERGLDAVLSAQSVSRFKPDALVYQMATSHFGVIPDSVCFVSANPWDVSGAAAFGFQVVWINRDNAPPERLPMGTKAVVNDLTALPGILEG